MRASCAVIAGLVVGAAPAHADDRPAAPTEDPRATFGLPPKQPPADAAPAEDPRASFGLPADPRDAFGLSRPPPASAPSCADGLAFACATATDPLDDATPYALATWLPAAALLRLPVGDATHDQVAGYALGASHDDAGLVFGGATGLENRWTIEGAPADDVRTGGADTRVPLVFLSGLRVSAGGSSARDRASTGGTVDARLVRGTAEHEVRAEVWGSVIRTASHRPSATGSYTVRRATGDAGPSTTAALVATGPLGGGAWYAAGVAPQLSTLDVTWRAARLVDADGDGVPDGLPGEVQTTPVETTETRALRSSVPVLARVGLDRGVHQLDLSIVGSVDHSPQFRSLATEQAAGVDRRDVVGDAIATWRGTWPTTRARVQLAWHHHGHREAARAGAAADLPQLLSAYIPRNLADDPVLAAACDDLAAGDPTPTIANCPVPFGFFASGGAGRLTDTAADRPSVTGELAHQLGAHTLRAGATLEDSQLVTTERFTGGEEDRTLFAGELARRRFYTGTCDDTAPTCAYVDQSELTYRTVYAAAFVEDTYAPVPGLAIDAGLRWELMWVGARLHFSSQLAPRLGVTWDPLGGGRTQLWASYGRTYLLLPAVLGETVIDRATTVDDFEVGGMSGRSHDAGATFRVEAGTVATRQDEVTAGGEVALIGALRATLWGQARWLRDGLETFGDGFGNPPGAKRQTQVVAGQLEMVQQGKMAIRAGVLWGRTVGTWAGPYDPRLGVNALAGPDFDTTTTNLDGTLPTDAGGQAFFEAERRGRLAGVELAAATRLTVASGRPRDVLADGGDGTIELLPRGAGGRNELVTQANARLAASWRGYTATLDVFNLFDRRAVTDVDETYTSDAVRPIAGGTAADLAQLKTDSGRNATRRTAYLLPIAYQAPLQITLGIHKKF